MSVSSQLPLFHVVAFTGHRTIAQPAAIADAIRTALESLRQEGSGEWIAVSSVAVGGDLLFARLALDLRLAWQAVLPLPAAEFQKDFSADEWQEVEALLPAAEQVRVIGESGFRDEAYLDAGMETVHECDVLLAVWDGEPARGKGGTADVIAYARELGRPLVLIDASTGDTRRENFQNFRSRDPELDFLNGLPFVSSGPPVPTDGFAAPEALYRFQQKTDHAATRRAPHFRRLTASVVLLHAFATLVAATTLAFQLHWIFLPWVKLLGVLGALIVALTIQYYRAQHVWVRCRLASEVGRSSLAMWGLPRASALFEDLDLPEIRQLTRSLQILHRRAAAAKPVRMEEFKHLYLTRRIDDQRAYYSRQLKRALPQLKRLRLGFEIATLMAILSTAAYAIDHTWHLGWLTNGAESFFYYLVPIALPVIAAAFVSLISINDLHRRVARYREMGHVLDAARKQITFSQTWTSLERIVRRTERALLQEVIEWRTLTSHIETHG